MWKEFHDKVWENISRSDEMVLFPVTVTKWVSPVQEKWINKWSIPFGIIRNSITSNIRMLLIIWIPNRIIQIANSNSTMIRMSDSNSTGIRISNSNSTGIQIISEFYWYSNNIRILLVFEWYSNLKFEYPQYSKIHNIPSPIARGLLGADSGRGWPVAWKL